MSSMKIVVCKPGINQVNLRSAPQIEATQVGTLRQGMSLDVVRAGGAWHACKVYVSTTIADAADGFVALKPNVDVGNIRRVPHLANQYDVGDLRQGQKLELIDRVGDWWVVRVHVSADVSSLMDVPITNGFDAPVGTAEER